MEQFSLEKYLENRNRKIITRDGRDVRIICTDRVNPFPIIFLVKKSPENIEQVFAADENGFTSLGGIINNLDLFFAPIKQSRWVFLYKSLTGVVCSSMAYKTKEEAQSYMENGCFALTEITWKE